MYHIKTFNKISPVGLNKFDAEHYVVSDSETNEDGILVRSAAMHEYEFPQALRAIARAQRFVEENDARTVAEALAPAFTETSVDTLEKVVERYRSIGAFAGTPVMKQEAYERLLDIMEQAGELDARAPYEQVINNSIAEKIVGEQ